MQLIEHRVEVITKVHKRFDVQEHQIHEWIVNKFQEGNGTMSAGLLNPEIMALHLIVENLGTLLNLHGVEVFRNTKEYIREVTDKWIRLQEKAGNLRYDGNGFRRQSHNVTYYP